METVEITDLYQASFYLVSGAEIVGVHCTPTNRGSICRIMMRVPNVADLAQLWLEKKAVANIWTFRYAQSQVNSQVQQAKRNFAFWQRRLVGNASDSGDVPVDQDALAPSQAPGAAAPKERKQ